MPLSLPRNLFPTVFLLASGVSVLAAEPQLQPVASPPPALTQLALHVNGRSLAEPTATGLQYVAQWPGTTFDAAFRGATVFLRIGLNHEILHLTVDHQPPLVLKAPTPGVYRLSGLRNTAHTVRLSVATESQSSPNTFGGFFVPAGEQPLPPPDASARQIEFIGDSHTVGYGNTSATTTCTTDKVWATTDTTQSFAALTAAKVHADYQVNAISGRGIVRNYNDVPGDTLPAAYPYTLLNDHTHPYADPAWRPQLIVVALGTNDFSTPLNPNEPWTTRDNLHADFEKTYVRFLQSLHTHNPNAWILVWATNMANGEIESEVQKAVVAAKAEGLTHLDYLPFDHLEFTGCHSHPSLADDRALATQFTTWIDAHPALWTGE